MSVGRTVIAVTDCLCPSGARINHGRCGIKLDGQELK
jgi:hypothetical protein